MSGNIIFRSSRCHRSPELTFKFQPPPSDLHFNLRTTTHRKLLLRRHPDPLVCTVFNSVGAEVANPALAHCRWTPRSSHIKQDAI